MKPNYRPLVIAFRHLSKNSQSKGSGPSKKSSSKTTSKEPETRQTDGNTYECPEYYGHNPSTFYDYMIDMSKHRLKQPSNKA